MKVKAGDGVAVYDYFDDEDVDSVAVTVLLTDDQTPHDMAQMLVESFGAKHCVQLVVALSNRLESVA